MTRKLVCMQVHGRFDFPGLTLQSANLAQERLNLVNSVEFHATRSQYNLTKDQPVV